MSAISSSFALPWTGGDLSCASHVPSACCSIKLERELGLTFMRMTLGGMFISLICRHRKFFSLQSFLCLQT